MKKLNYPKDGTYRYYLEERKPDGTKMYHPRWAKCKILAESEKMYQIQVLEIIPNRVKDEIFPARKKSVNIVQEKRDYTNDYVDSYWNRD